MDLVSLNQPDGFKIANVMTNDGLSPKGGEIKHFPRVAFVPTRFLNERLPL